jgi:lysophospholipase L1-like esterase
MNNKWVTGFAASQCASQTYACRYNGRTIRAKIVTQIAGEKLRLHLGNDYGKNKIIVEKMTIYHHGVFIPIMVNASRMISLQKRERKISDEIVLSVQKGESLEIRMFFRNNQCPTSAAGLVSVEHSDLGDYTEKEFVADHESIWVTKNRPLEIGVPMPIVTGIEVLAEEDACAVAIFGASNEFLGRWVNPFTERVQNELNQTAILNVSLAGNRLLRDTGNHMLLGDLFGDKGTRRIEWDVLAYSGIKHLMIHLGGNDYCQPGSITAPIKKIPTLETMIKGYESIIKQCHEHGIRVIGITITPAGNSTNFNESKAEGRRRVNDWIRTGGSFDDVFDFASKISDPQNHEILRPEYDTGDHLHISPQGGKFIAEDIDLSLIK